MVLGKSYCILIFLSPILICLSFAEEVADLLAEDLIVSQIMFLALALVELSVLYRDKDKISMYLDQQLV